RRDLETLIRGERMIRHVIRSVFVGALALVSFAHASAEDFPTRPITIVVGLAAGGITDVSARLYAETVSKSIGQRIVIENRQRPATESRGGAAGGAGPAAGRTAPPAGYRLLVFSGSQHATVPGVQSAPYEPVKGFQPITLLFNLAAFITVPADSPAKTMQDLL